MNAVREDHGLPSRRAWCLLGIVLAALVSGGCSLVPARPDDQPDIDAMRRQRNAQAVRQFEENRTAAELLAARNRWEQGDEAGCRAGLERILLHNPDQPEAKRLLAQMAEAEKKEPAPAAVSECTPIQLLLTEGNPSPRSTLMRKTECDMKRGPSGRDGREELDGHAGTERLQALLTSPDAQTVQVGLATPQASEVTVERISTDVPALLPSDSGAPKPESRPAQPQPARCKRPEPEPPRPAARPETLPMPEAPKSQAAPAAKPAATAKAKPAVTAKAEPAASEPRTVEGQLDLAEEALRRADDDSAWGHIRTAALLRRQDPQIPTTAAVTALRYNRTRLAVEILNDAAHQFPESAAIHRTLGAAYYRLGDYKSSQVALQQALSLDKSNGLTYFLLGCTLAKLGRPEAAESQFRQAALIDPRYAIQR